MRAGRYTILTDKGAALRILLSRRPYTVAALGLVAAIVHPAVPGRADTYLPRENIQFMDSATQAVNACGADNVGYAAGLHNGTTRNYYVPKNASGQPITSGPEIANWAYNATSSGKFSGGQGYVCIDRARRSPNFYSNAEVPGDAGAQMALAQQQSAAVSVGTSPNSDPQYGIWHTTDRATADRTCAPYRGVSVVDLKARKSMPIDAPGAAAVPIAGGTTEYSCLTLAAIYQQVTSLAAAPAAAGKHHFATAAQAAMSCPSVYGPGNGGIAYFVDTSDAGPLNNTYVRPSDPQWAGATRFGGSYACAGDIAATNGNSFAATSTAWTQNHSSYSSRRFTWGDPAATPGMTFATEAQARGRCPAGIAFRTDGSDWGPLSGKYVTQNDANWSSVMNMAQKGAAGSFHCIGDAAGGAGYNQTAQAYTDTRVAAAKVASAANPAKPAPAGCQNRYTDAPYDQAPTASNALVYKVVDDTHCTQTWVALSHIHRDASGNVWWGEGYHRVVSAGTLVFPAAKGGYYFKIPLTGVSDESLHAGAVDALALKVGGTTIYVDKKVIHTVVDPRGRLLPGFYAIAGPSGSVRTFFGAEIIGAGAGNIIAAGSGNIIAAGSGNIIGAGAGNIIGAGAGNIIGAGAGNIISSNNAGVIGAGAGNYVWTGATIIAAGSGNAVSAVKDAAGPSGIIAAGSGNIIGAGAGN